jgi:hypothetical protein
MPLHQLLASQRVGDDVPAFPDRLLGQARVDDRLLDGVDSDMNSESTPDNLPADRCLSGGR